MWSNPAHLHPSPNPTPNLNPGPDPDPVARSLYHYITPTLTRAPDEAASLLETVTAHGAENLRAGLFYPELCARLLGLGLGPGLGLGRFYPELCARLLGLLTLPLPLTLSLSLSLSLALAL